MKAESWRVAKAGPRDLKNARRLLEASELTVDGLEETELWCVRGESGGLIGIAGLETWGRQGLLRSVVVDGKYRKSGVGKALVEHVFEEASSRELAELFLITETASRFFERFGFTPFERKKVSGKVLNSVEFREACPETAPVMRIVL